MKCLVLGISKKSWQGACTLTSFYDHALKTCALKFTFFTTHVHCTSFSFTSFPVYHYFFHLLILNPQTVRVLHWIELENWIYTGYILKTDLFRFFSGKYHQLFSSRQQFVPDISFQYKCRTFFSCNKVPFLLMCHFFQVMPSFRKIVVIFLVKVAFIQKVLIHLSFPQTFKP